MLEAVLALLVAAADPTIAAFDAPSSSPASSRTGNLQLGPDAQGSVSVIDEAGRTVAEVTLRPGQTVTLPLTEGTYRLVGSEGRPIDTVRVRAGQSTHAELPTDMRAEPAAPVAEPGAAGRSRGESDEIAVVSMPEIETTDRGTLRVTGRARWRRIGAPILSAVLPGLGQAVNRQPGRAIAFFTGTVSLALAAAAVWTARDRTEGATPGDAGLTDAQEIMRLGAFSAFTGAAGLLYLGQIMDAHAVAADKKARPTKTHSVAIEAMRASTVGFAAGQPEYDLYTDWSVAVIGQLVPRLTFGLSDISIKWHRARDATTVQGGLRVSYRFYDRRRIWLGTGGGILMQGTTAAGQPEPIDPFEERPDRQRRFSAMPYVHFDARLFVLDHWYLGLLPRVGVPLVERRFRRDQSIPRYATTFELGLTAGVLF